MGDAKTRSFGRVIRERRRQLDLTQEEVAQRIKTTGPYITHLETGKRHPSSKVVVKLSDALGLDSGELFLLANPKVGSIISAPPEAGRSLCLGCFRRGQDCAQDSQHNRPRDEYPLACSEDGRGTRPTRLHLYPNHH